MAQAVNSSVVVEQPEQKAINIAHNIVQDYIISEDIIIKWNSLTNLIREQMIVAFKEITPVTAEKYIFDFAGLLKHEFNMQSEWIYPHILANGYFSGTEYDGKLLRIALLNTEKLNRYTQLFYAKDKS